MNAMPDIERKPVDEVIEVASGAYPGGIIGQIDKDNQGEEDEGYGDTLALFIVREIRSLCGDETNRPKAFIEAALAMRRAACELDRVALSLERHQ